MSGVDPVLASVIAKRLKSITEEMGLTLLRTTRSPILNEARDFVTGLYDANGDMLEQTEYIPVLAFALQPVCKQIIEFFGDEIVNPSSAFFRFPPRSIQANPETRELSDSLFGWNLSR